MVTSKVCPRVCKCSREPGMRQSSSSTRTPTNKRLTTGSRRPASPRSHCQCKLEDARCLAYNAEGEEAQYDRHTHRTRDQQLCNTFVWRTSHENRRCHSHHLEKR